MGNRGLPTESRTPRSCLLVHRSWLPVPCRAFVKTFWQQVQNQTVARGAYKARRLQSVKGVLLDHVLALLLYQRKVSSTWHEEDVLKFCDQHLQCLAEYGLRLNHGSVIARAAVAMGRATNMPTSGTQKVCSPCAAARLVQSSTPKVHLVVAHIPGKY